MIKLMTKFFAIWFIFCL